MNYTKLGISSFGQLLIYIQVAFGISSYVAFKFEHILRFHEEFSTIKDQKETLYKIHQRLAFDFDDLVDGYEKGSKIDGYRKTLISYAEGLILETGIGTSRNLKYYQPGSKIIGVDWASNMIEMCFSKVNSNKVEVQYKIEDVERMNIKDNTFDTVIDTFALEYYANPDKALNGIQLSLLFYYI